MVEPIYQDFGRTLAEKRQEAGLSQDRLAGRVGLSRTSIVNIEKGRQRVALHLVVALAAAVEVKPAELLPKRNRKGTADADRLDAKRNWIARVTGEEVDQELPG